MPSSVALRVRLSIANPAVERLLVCIGTLNDEQGSEARGALGRLVARKILETCAPSPSDVQNPDENRIQARDAKGRTRERYAFRQYGPFARHTCSHSGSRFRRPCRNAQTWDSERVSDYMGVWCDRLLLGEHNNPRRCALLEPRVPVVMVGESLERVLLAHRGLRGSDILFIFGSPCFPFGATRLISFSDALLDPLCISYPSRHQLVGTVLHCLECESSIPSALVVGLGSTHGLRTAFEPEEKVLIESRIVPLLGFVSALWTVDPLKASEYLQSNPQNNARLWGTMQSSMLSTRDAALLRAFESGQPLDARLSQQHTAYLAETLLDRLFPQSGQ
ncbi:hypothetical protein, conserved [Trypanosoma brucei brucei TREU927]|uniref:Uncharacterized protein n=1 Tax=Trypanosoma brucei brucei (strain 927/4 GUTat10.1) TaxID=185431 RepID=Q389P8_TRYB2|nr:hypothetical protein, conserved [Trypanosoma brucei brucei TREU927]EAN78472.1 hypothetical protein, conserved [Trypanosoma brucei brucei TREU927]